jgi:hypothetical protein
MPDPIQIVVDGTVLFVAATTPKQTIDSIILCATFAQAAARVKSRNFASPEFFSELVNQLDKVGWRSRDVGHSTLSQTMSQSTFAKLLSNIAQPALKTDPNLAELFTAWQARTESDVLSFWWNFVKSGRIFNLGLGSLSADDTVAPTIRLLLFNIEILDGSDGPRGSLLDSSNWKCLFQQIDGLTYVISWRNLTAQQDAAAYERVKPQLEERLGSKLKEHVRVEPVFEELPDGIEDPL